MIPDAVEAVIAAAFEENPTVTPERAARIAVQQLREQGWHFIPDRPVREPR